MNLNEKDENELMDMISRVQENGEKDEILTAFAVANNDPKYCKMLNNLIKQTMCLAFVKKDISYCDMGIPDSYKNGCYTGLAILNNDKDMCNYISEHRSKDFCLLVLSRINQNVSLCEQIKDRILSKHCKALRTKNVSLCEQMRLLEDKNLCKLWIGIYTKNCEIIEDLKDRQMCSILIGNKHSLSFIKDNIIAMYAVIHRDASLCPDLDCLIEVKQMLKNS